MVEQELQLHKLLREEVEELVLLVRMLLDQNQALQMQELVVQEQHLQLQEVQ
jgi:hypothetical protein